VSGLLDPIAFAKWRHDLKNQLGVILGFSSLLLNEMAADDSRRDDIQEIHAAAEHALRLVEAVHAQGEPERS
jgi:signal transduction histidine kinase